MGWGKTAIICSVIYASNNFDSSSSVIAGFAWLVFAGIIFLRGDE